MTGGQNPGEIQLCNKCNIQLYTCGVLSKTLEKVSVGRKYGAIGVLMDLLFILGVIRRPDLILLFSHG